MDWIENLARKHGTGGWQTLDDMVQFGKAVAEEVRRRVGIGGELIAARRERDELAAELANAGDAEIDWLRNALEHIAGSCEGRAAEIAREALMGPNALGQEPCAAVCARSPAPTGYASGD